MAEYLSGEEHVEPGAAEVAFNFSFIFYTPIDILTNLMLITAHTTNHNLNITDDTGYHECSDKIFKEAAAPSAQRCC